MFRAVPFLYPGAFMRTLFVSLPCFFGLLLLISHSAFADGIGTPEEIEGVYQKLCVPGFLEKSETGSALEDLKKARSEFLAFFSNPIPVLAPLEADAIKGSGGDQFFANFAIAVNCGITSAIQQDVETRGCVDEKGKSYNVANALAACANTEARIERAHANPSPKK